MLRIYAEDFLNLLDSLARLEIAVRDLVEKGAAHGWTFGPDARRNLWDLVGPFLNELEPICQRMELKSALCQIGRLRDQFGNDHDGADIIHSSMRELGCRVRDEFKCQVFMFLSVKDAAYWTTTNPFGGDVTARHSNLVGEFEEASRCMAVGRFAAAVFHLMRVMERAVHYFARKLGIKKLVIDDKDWGRILGLINGGLDVEDGRLKAAMSAAGPKTPTTAQVWAQIKMAKQKLTRRRETAIYLHHVKEALRNPTMHPKRTYNEEEADLIFASVRSFVQSLFSL